MVYARLALLFVIGFSFQLPENNHYIQYNAPLSIAEQIVGTWYLEDQEMLINGNEINEHFEELAAQLSASSDYRVDPQMLAKKFKEGFKGIPDGTIFKFEDDFSYRIILPDDRVQTGMWRIKNGNDILLQAVDQELLLRVKNLSAEKAVFSIREAKVESQLSAGGYTVMELILGLSR